MESEAPWLDEMVSLAGTSEVAGKKANPVILALYADVGHPEIKDDSVAWCAACVGAALKRSGWPIPPVNVNLLARSYLTYGVACEPKRGAIMILPRGNSTWQGHVGVVTKVYARTIDYVAGNQSNAVAYGKANIDDVLDFRWPVEPTVPALRAAGSKEVRKADNLEKAGIIASAAGPVLGGLKSLIGPVEVPEFASLPESLSWWQTLLGGLNAVGKLILDHPWIAVFTFVGLATWAISRQFKAARLEKHLAGVPLSVEVAKLGSA